MNRSALSDNFQPTTKLVKRDWDLYRLYNRDNQMINLQNSKKLLKTYDQMLANVFPNKQSSKRVNNLNRTLFDERNVTFVNNRSRQQQTERSTANVAKEEAQRKKQSSLVTIEFKEHQRLRQNAEIRLRRRMLTSNQKIYNQKKHAYSNYIKEIYLKVNDELTKTNNFLTVGSHVVRKMDYAEKMISKQFKASSQYQTSLRSKLRQQLNLSCSRDEQDMKVSKQTFKKVLVIDRKNQKLDAMMPFLKPQKQKQKQRGTLNQQKANTSIYGTNAFNSTTMDQFIPIKKALSKKQPFVFGMSEKQASEKLKDKLLVYHDFLWKLNYANGLYVSSASDQTVYRAYIGPGNNSCMLRGIIRRRFWWTIADKQENCQFIWTQLKVNNVFKQMQSPSPNKFIYSQDFDLALDSDTKTLEDLKNIRDVADPHERIFNIVDFTNWAAHFRKNKKSEESISQKTYLKRVNLMNKKKITKIEDSGKITLHNHLQQNFFIGNKKALFYNMKRYYELQNKNVFSVLPLTFHLTKGLEDPQFANFLSFYNKFEQQKKKGSGDKNIWIMKPGQNSNRGNGISVCHSLDDIKFRLKCKQKNSDGSLRTFIVQQYIERPLLYKNRKFDIRHYLLITCFNGCVRAYWFPQGYIRTSSAVFNLKRGTNLFVHLTNDAIQKNSDQYGKYQKGNKVSYQKFQNYLDKTLSKSKKNIFFDKILPKMKQMTIQAINSTYLSLSDRRTQHNFQLLGMDYMIDDNLNPWLIQVNTNPCLQMSSPLLARLIPSLIQNVFKICLDPFFPPPEDWPNNKKMFVNDNPIDQNLFELIFDEAVDGAQVQKVFKGNFKLDSSIGKIQEDDDVYEDDGNDEWENQQQNL